jgi:peptidyl-prolyl cis-trans isomerase D
MNGGNPLTNQQIQQFRIQESALQNLVQKKLALSLGDKLGTEPSIEEIKNEIKELPYFKTNGQFDVEKYKLLLRQNSLTPNDFEEALFRKLTAEIALMK